MIGFGYNGRGVTRAYLLTHLIDLTDYPLACHPTENALKMLIQPHWLLT